jgi:hypothetical protein
MANYDLYKGNNTGQSPKFGTFWLHFKLNFAQNNFAANDTADLIKLKDKWIVRDSYWRVTTASTSVATADIGIHTATNSTYTDQGIVAGASLDLSTATDWAQDTIDPDANQKILTADSFVFIENLSATTSDGVVEVLIEVVAGPDDAEPCDMNIEDS